MGRLAIAGPLVGIVWLVALFVFFGPAQVILQNPDYQSAKMLAVFGQLEPPPLMATAPWLVVLGFLVLATIYTGVFAVVAPALPGEGWRKGIGYGLILWLVQILWFEFFIVWNVLREPATLVLLELALWLLVTQVVGITIALLVTVRVRTEP